MNSITSKLKQKLGEHPTSVNLRSTLSHLEALRKSSGDAVWNDLVHDFEVLEAEGLWDASEENSKLLHDLHTFIALPEGSVPSELSSSIPVRPPPASETRGKSIVQPPPNAMVFPDFSLPLELVDSLNQAYFLHLLAMEPTKVLPPGKSILSMMSRPHIQPKDDEDALPSLQQKVENIAQRAFWDEARDSLSSAEPSSQLSRLKLLYRDLHTALLPLLPPTHPILVTLSSHFSPTPSPLSSAVFHLREVLSALRARCAPARDAYVDSLLHTLQNVPPAHPNPSTLAKIVVDTVESILQLSNAMKDDLSQFVLGSMNEKQLRAVIMQRARADERQIVLKLWRPEQIQHFWAQWLAELQPDTVAAEGSAWIHRLLKALKSSTPVSSRIPTSSAQNDEGGNFLPPPFFFSTPEVLYIQNFIQAIVIAAALRSLTRLSPPSAQDSGSDFMERIWTLLRLEIDETEGSGDTKVVNLADEVLRARVQTPTAGADIAEEKRLRAAVERTLQPNDPVFILLQKRLLSAMTSRLHQLPSSGGTSRTVAPAHMQTGREGDRAATRLRPTLNTGELGLDVGDWESRHEEELVVKGFEEPVLVKAIGEALGRLRGCLDWVASVWEDVLANGEVSSR